MSGAYRISLDELDNLISRMAMFEAFFQEAYEQADAQSRQLGATWSGSAAEAHQAVHARWSAGVQQMHEALVTMRSIAQTAQENYTAVGSTNARMWAL